MQRMDYQIRTASAGDADHIVNHRRRMFVDAGEPDNDRMAEISRAFRDWLSGRLGDGRYLGWLCMADDQVVGGLGMVVFDWPPGPLHLAPGRGYLRNMSVDPEHRRKGLARLNTGGAGRGEAPRVKTRRAACDASGASAL
jgi:GNAT superfamily N-acetyltransferase